MEQKREQELRALRMLHPLRKEYHGNLLLAGGFDHETAEQRVQEGKADLIAFGRKFLANPDLLSAFVRVLRSTRTIPQRITAEVRPAISITQAWHRKEARSRSLRG